MELSQYDSAVDPQTDSHSRQSREQNDQSQYHWLESLHHCCKFVIEFVSRTHKISLLVAVASTNATRRDGEWREQNGAKQNWSADHEADEQSDLINEVDPGYKPTTKSPSNPGHETVPYLCFYQNRGIVRVQWEVESHAGYSKGDNHARETLGVQISKSHRTASRQEQSDRHP